MMSWLPDPVWPVIVLAVITFGDALMCIKPVPFIAQCWRDVHFPERWWRLAMLLKFAAAAGLLMGLIVPGLALLTTVCLVAYFVVAIVFHVRASDLGRNLFVNATGMLLICCAVLLWCFVL